uniref:Uncharacterized protein n=1 Tax=Anguilla anguilla TaxID=7936 RepID=A0A0E9R901_ANGAN
MKPFPQPDDNHLISKRTNVHKQNRGLQSSIKIQMLLF